MSYGSPLWEKRLWVTNGEHFNPHWLRWPNILLPSPSSYCLLRDRPTDQETVVGARIRDFIWKAGRLRRWWTHVPKNHLAWVRIQGSFIIKGKGVKSNIFWFWSASRGDVFISSCLQSFTGGPGQDDSCELNKGILGASLVAQWLRIRLPMQGTRVRAPVWEDPTCRGATKPVRHNYWACASGACAPQQERPR